MQHENEKAPYLRGFKHAGDRDRTGLDRFSENPVFMRISRKPSIYAGFKRFIFETVSHI